MNTYSMAKPLFHKKAGDTIVIQLVLDYGENTLSSANVWLVDESGKVIVQWALLNPRI